MNTATLSFFTITDQNNILIITEDRAPVCQSISGSIQPSLMNDTPRYVTSSAWDKGSPDQRGDFSCFRLRSMASYLEKLSLFQLLITQLQTAPVHTEGYGLKNRTTSFAKSEDESLKCPNQTPSSPQLHHEILSMTTLGQETALSESNTHQK